MQVSLEKKKIVEDFLEKGILLEEGFLDELGEDFDIDNFYSKLLEKGVLESEVIVNNELRHSVLSSNFGELGSGDNNEEERGARGQGGECGVEIISSYEKISQKKAVKDFVTYFHKRFDAIEGILRGRQELQNVRSISRLLQQGNGKEQIAIIGIVKEVSKTKNMNYVLKVEDKTGEISVLINKNKPDLYKQAATIVPDEVIGVVGTGSQSIIFANNVLWPDVPLYKELKKSPDEEFALFLSDIHVGSNTFLGEEFERFLSWLNLEIGTDEHKEVVKKIKYIFIIGDLVDGVGIYPGQEEELTITEITEQYNEVARLLKKIPSRIKLIICPGNHDAMRLAEPQLPIYEEFAGALYDLPNVEMVSNPSIVNIAKKETFPGFDILLYHGYSFDHYIANVDEIRNNGGYDRADLVMKFLLQRRHLAPTHASSLYIPDTEEDPMVIKKIPDIFCTGHIHKSSVSHYRNITLISGSCWQAKTAFQEKVGHRPEPCRVPLVNLKTRDVKILKFG
jgi:DNA polymerase II small subunit